jgi:hypothetical protein
LSLTPVLVTGFENGVAAFTTNGGGLTNQIGNGTAISVQNSIKHSGSYAMRQNVAGTTSWIAWTVTGTHVNASVYVYFATLPNTKTGILGPDITAGYAGQIRWNTDTSQIALWNNSTFVDMQALGTGTWYHFQCYFDCSAGTTVFKCRIDEGPEFSHSVVQAASTYTLWNCMVGQNSTTDVYFDDVIVSQTAADYPIPASAVVGLSPSSDGSHVTAANTIEFQDGTDVGNGTTTTTAYTAVNTVPMGGTVTYLQQTTTGAYYANLKLNTAQTNIIGAEALLAYRSSSTTADKGACYIIDGDAGTTTIWGNPTTTADYSETSTFYKRKVMTVPTGGWQAGSINAYSWRVGNSDDISPKPYWLDLMLQVGYSTVTNGTVTPGDGFQAQVGDVSTVSFAAASANITPADGFQAQTGDTAGASAAYSIASAEGLQTQVGDTATVRATYLTTPVDGFQTQVGDASTVSFTAAPVSATPSDGFQAQTGDTATVYAAYRVTPAEGQQDQSQPDPPTVRAGYPVTPLDGFQAQTGDTAGATATYSLTPEQGYQAQTGDTTTLSGSVGITPNDGFQTQTGDTASVNATYAIVPADGFQSQTGDAATLSGSVSITPIDGFQTQTGDGAGIAVGYYINPEQGFQTQTGDLFTLTENETTNPIVFPTKSLLIMTNNILSMGQGNVLVIKDEDNVTDIQRTLSVNK